MKVISTRAHGLLDYIVAIALIIAPWALGFARSEAETWVPVLLGVGTILYSLLTNYEWGAARVISMRTHLIIDGLAGLFLAASPWLFNFSDYVYLPHLIVGIFEMLAAVMTDPQRRTATHDHGFRNPVHSH